jgi:hypothetical protein
MTKSPFILIENVLTQKACSEIIASLNHSEPNYMYDKVALTIKFNKLEELRLQSLIDDVLDHAEAYYGFETLKTAPYIFEWYPETYQAKPISSDSNIYFEGKWAKSRDIDFTILIFLSTQKTDSIDNRIYEHVGGGLQFPTHGFTLHPKAGDLLMFPSNRYFLNTIGSVNLGNMNLIRILVTAKTTYKYDRHKFPGTFKDWF